MLRRRLVRLPMSLGLRRAWSGCCKMSARGWVYELRVEVSGIYCERIRLLAFSFGLDACAYVACPIFI